MLQNAREVVRTLVVALALNILVATAKTLYGFWTNTLSMIADGLHSYTDAASSVIGILSIRVASRPKDDDHHYGHQKFETLAALGIGLFIALTGYEVVKNAYGRLFHPAHPTYHSTGVWVIGIGMLINIGLSIFERRRGKKYDSTILVADALHTASDVWVSFSVLVSLVCLKFQLYWVDAVVSLVIGIYFGFVSYRLIRENVLVLSDAAFIDAGMVERLVLDVPRVISCHHIRTRGRPGSAFIDLHIQIDADTDTSTAHKIVHDIEDRLKAKISGVQDVIIHTEPYPDHD